MRKKFLAVALAAALACNMTAAPAAAQSTSGIRAVLDGLFGGDSSDKEDKKQDAKEDTKDEKEGAASENKADGQGSAAQSGSSGSKAAGGAALDIGKGDIIIRQKEISAFDVNGNPVTDIRSQYVVTGYSEENTIMVDSGASADIVLSDATIIQSAEGESPLWLADDAGNVQVTLQGSNTLQAGPGAAAIQKNCTHNGTDCKCKRLEITCGNTSGSHVCDSECGTLNATGGAGAAAIGGAAGMGCANLNIKGGMITANGGVGGASGAIGTDVSITGGMVNAGAVSGKDGGENVMRGNTLVFADSSIGLERDKGVLYENGAGTVYGNVKLSQGMADYLPAGTPLTIPDGSSLTVDEGTVLPNAENVIGEVTVKQDKKSKNAEPTEEPVVEEEIPFELNAASGNASGNATVTPTPVEGVCATTTTAVVMRNGSVVNAGASLVYGEKLTISSTIQFMGNKIDPSLTKPAEPNKIKFYLRDKKNQNNKIFIGEDAVANLPTTPGGLINCSQTKDIVLTQPAIVFSEDYQFIAEYTGTDIYPSSGTAEAIDYKVQQGTLSFSPNVKNYDAIAGRTIEETMGGDIDVLNSEIKPVNLGGEPVIGSWKWSGGTSKTQVLYPPTADAQSEFKAYFEFQDSREQDKYTPCELTVRFNVTARTLDEKIKESSDQAPVKGHDDKTWYNHDSGKIELSLDNYEFLDETSNPVSVNGWANAKWTNKIVFPVDSGVMDFHSGRYEMFVRQITGSKDICRAVIEEFNVDRVYPVITSAEHQKTGETVAWQFRAAQENDASRGSGVYMQTFRVQQRRGTGGAINTPLTKEEVAKSSKKNQTGDFSFENLSPNTEYDVYLLVEDNAGNETQYITRIIDSTGNTVGEAGKPTDSSVTDAAPNFANVQSRYGYEFLTDKQNMKGKVTLTVTDPAGMEKRGEVAIGDTITATVNPDIIDPGTLHYSWWRLPKDSRTESLIPGAVDAPTYVVQGDDVDHYIICRVRGDNTAVLSTIAEEVGPVQRGVCPADNAPHDGVVDDAADTFTFQGLGNVTYEYSINDGEWQDVPFAGGSNTFVIYVGDVTIFKGNLKVRAKQTDTYLASNPPLTNEESFISKSELKVEIEGEAQYGELIRASVNSDAIDPSLITFQWSYADGGAIDNIGNTYEIKKEDIRKTIQVKAVVDGITGVDNSAKVGPIGKRKVNAEVNVTPKQYDGTTDGEATVGLSGLINNDVVTATVDVSFADKEVGEDKAVTLKNKKEEGADLAYYDVRWPNSSDVKGTIQPRTLELQMTASDKVYDGTTDAEVVMTANPLPGDKVIVTGTGEFADKNVGTNKPVTSKDIEISGDDAANYTAAGSSATATASITPKDIELESISVADKVYDDTTDATITATFKGAVDDVSYTYKAQFESPSVGKDKKVTATVTLSGDSAKNYTLANGEITGKGNIVKALAPYDEENVPKDLTGIEGKKLSSVYIGNGFTWKDPSTVMETVGRHSYPAYYNPDPNQYGNREVELEVLVQCAKHTWGDWSITVEPTKEEMGERQRVCSVCGYTEVETIPRAPYVANDDSKVGWGDIIQAINNASSGTEIPVVMNGTETLPASVLETLQGREVSLVLQMGDGITWTIRGEDITASTLKDINMALTMYTDNIPSDVIDPYVKGKTAVQLHLAYSGEFGFIATLRVPFADEFAGVNSTLYYYNPTRGRLEQMDKNRITDDGIGRYDFNHASDYVVIIDKASDTQGGDTPSSNATPGASGTTGGAAGSTTVTPATTTPGATTQITGTAARTTSANNARFISSNGAKTSDDTPIAVYVALLVLGAAGIGAFGYYRKKKK